MAQSRPSVLKRQRERLKMEKRRIKEMKRAERALAAAEESEEEVEAPAGVDPDIAHIVPGPQRQPWMEDDPDE